MNRILFFLLRCRPWEAAARQSSGSGRRHLHRLGHICIHSGPLCGSSSSAKKKLWQPCRYFFPSFSLHNHAFCDIFFLHIRRFLYIFWIGEAISSQVSHFQGLPHHLLHCYLRYHKGLVRAFLHGKTCFFYLRLSSMLFLGHGTDMRATTTGEEGMMRLMQVLNLRIG